MKKILYSFSIILLMVLSTGCDKPMPADKCGMVVDTMYFAPLLYWPWVNLVESTTSINITDIEVPLDAPLIAVKGEILFHTKQYTIVILYDHTKFIVDSGTHYLYNIYDLLNISPDSILLNELLYVAGIGSPYIDNMQCNGDGTDKPFFIFHIDKDGLPIVAKLIAAGGELLIETLDGVY